MSGDDAYTRLAMLRYLEEKCSGLLRNVLYHDPGIERDVEERLSQVLRDHDRHSRELNVTLRDAGHQAEPVPTRYQDSIEQRVRAVGQARDKDEVVVRLADLEEYAAHEFETAMRGTEPEFKELLHAQFADELGHAHFLAEKAHALAGK